MTRPDLICLALLALAMLLDHFVLWPAFQRRSTADSGRARRWLWSSWMIELWGMAALVIALWIVERRAWGEIRLLAPHGWRLWTGIGLVMALALSFAPTIAKFARHKRTKRIKLAGHVESLAPHTGIELAWWTATSVSAGVCEELVFRGYLIWIFQSVIGIWPAAAVSVVIFAAVHSYQGPKGALGAGIVGCLLTLVVLMLGSLWPAIVLHAVIDIGQGTIAWLVLRKLPEGAANSSK